MRLVVLSRACVSSSCSASSRRLAASRRLVVLDHPRVVVFRRVTGHPPELRRWGSVETPDGPATIMAAVPCALDLSTGDVWAASSGDYLTLRDDEPVRGEDGEPCLLVVPFSGYRDALTGEVI